MRALARRFEEVALNPPDHKAAKIIAKRFIQWPGYYFEFLTDEGLRRGVAPTNNAAEQSVKHVVLDRVVTQGTRSLKGRERSEKVWTVIASCALQQRSSCALQQRSSFAFIKDSIMAHFRGVGEYPSLLSNDKA